MTVKANVIDLPRHLPRSSDSLLLDTNVLHWMAYEPDVDARSEIKLPYRSFIEAATECGASLWHSALSLAELTHVIEKTEFRVWWREQGNPLPLDTRQGNREMKLFRAMTEQRERVCSQIERAWKLVRSWSEPIDVPVDHNASTAMLQKLRAHTLDAYDALMLHAMRRSGVNQILTADSDFGDVAGLEVFTAHGYLIGCARSDGMLGRPAG